MEDLIFLLYGELTGCALSSTSPSMSTLLYVRAFGLLLCTSLSVGLTVRGNLGSLEGRTWLFLRLRRDSRGTDTSGSPFSLSSAICLVKPLSTYSTGYEPKTRFGTNADYSRATDTKPLSPLS